MITQHEGKRTLLFRAGNRRSNVIVEATIHVTAVFTTLTMVRDRQVGMTRGWTLMHVMYTDEQIRIDHHFEDTLIVLDNREYVVDMTKLDAVVPDSTTRDSVRP